ncbi:hypothetical protein RJ640_023750 [Escallonia rubra]|uniref:Retrotransposon gag domain-containing protein n=1 Tax=Escallonia rubra TaxID=112253 RepID=A0AA88R4F7_9ASTE|nr:hypothetical protein RJ640_023750 [Escallonia rubra]
MAGEEVEELVDGVSEEALVDGLAGKGGGGEAASMFKSDQDAPGILKQFSLRLDALEDRVEHHTRHTEGIDWESKFQELQDRVELLSRAVVNTPVRGAEHSSRPRVPEPKSYGGARDAKELENFLFDIEQYFRAIRVDSEATKVSMAAMYLVGDAKLWWRKKYAEIEDGSCVINTWDILKRELRSQFFPENTAFNARKVLLEYKHTGSVREYCHAFFALMLDISDMSAFDRLFFFMEGLKPWAHTELNRRRVNNLNEAIIAAESLSDYNSEPQRPSQRGNLSRSNGGKKPGGQAPSQCWGSKSSWVSNSSTQQKNGVVFKAKPDASTSGEVKKPAFRGCFLCQGPHVIANCPHRQMMNAFFDNIGQVQRGEQSGSQSRHPPTEEQTDAQDYEEEDVVGAFPQWCNAMTTQVGNPEESSTGEKPKDMPPKKKGDVPGKGLMYVDIKVNGKAIRAMVDTGATHNYISSTEVERLGLTLKKGCGRVKAINSAAQPVMGIARSVLIKIGPYEGRTNFSVVIMDDFKLILGLEFLRDTKTTVMPCTNSLAMLGKFMLEYRAGSTNSVADALSRRAELDQVALMAMNAIVRADSRVAINIGKKIRKALTRDPVAQQLLKLIESGKTRQFWQEDGLLMTKGRRNIDLAHSYLEKAARRMKKHADKNRRSQEFNVGDKVMVKLLPQDHKFLRGRDSRLLQKYEGPLTIVKKIGKMAYKVDPPNWWSRQLHPVFHVSMLKPFYEDTSDPSRGQIRRPGLKPKAAGKRVAEAILNDRVITASRKRHQEYLLVQKSHFSRQMASQTVVANIQENKGREVANVLWNGTCKTHVRKIHGRHSSVITASNTDPAAIRYSFRPILCQNVVGSAQRKRSSVSKFRTYGGYNGQHLVLHLATPLDLNTDHPGPPQPADPPPALLPTHLPRPNIPTPTIPAPTATTRTASQVPILLPRARRPATV